MNLKLRGSGRGALLLALLLIPRVGQGQAQPRESNRSAFLPFVGLGRFPRSKDVLFGVTDTQQLLIGASVEASVRSRLVLSPAIAVGFQPFGCPGGCARAMLSADLAVLWHATEHSAKWGVLLGPSIVRSSFDGARMGVGATASVGAVKGIGPRLTLRYHTLSGPRRPSSLVALFSLRLGR